MKLFAKLMIAVLFIAVLLPFTILKGPDGDTLMSFSSLELPNFSLPDMPKMPGGDKISAPLGGSDGKDIVYKWQDAEGSLHFTTEPPSDGTEYSVMGFDPNTNVIQAVKLPEEKEKEAEETASQPEKGDNIGNPYSPEKIDKLFEDAKNVEKLLKQRMKDQEAALNQ